MGTRADIVRGGSGLDADTLDGFDSAYFLDYNNFPKHSNTVWRCVFKLIHNSANFTGAANRFVKAHPRQCLRICC